MREKIVALRENVKSLSLENENNKKTRLRLEERNEVLESEKISLQQKLEPLLKFVERVKNSIVGKLFFNKEMKALPQGMETKSEQSTQTSKKFREEIKAVPRKEQDKGTVITEKKNEHEQR